MDSNMLWTSVYPKHLNFLLFALFWNHQIALAFPVPAVTNSSFCDDGYYFDRVCHPCSLCTLEEVQLQPCTTTSNTVCLQCHTNSSSKMTSNQYSAVDQLSNTRYCKNCTDCTDLHNKVEVPCTTTQDSVCGGCLDGYFLGVTKEGAVECLVCSWCPPNDETIIKWRECQDAGLSQDMWCSPGYVLPDSNNGSTPSNKTATTTLDFVGGDHFLSFTFQDITEDPIVGGSSVSVVVVALMTLGGTILTVLICMCTVGVCMHQARRMSVRIRPYSIIPLNSRTGSLCIPMEESLDESM